MNPKHNIPEVLRKLRLRRSPLIAVLFLALAILAGCSTEKNTAQTRRWHSFMAKYNTYYNGSQAYIDASIEKENGIKDNFTEMIPLYAVGNKRARELGKGNYERAIEKSQKAIKLHSIKRRPEFKKKKRTEKDIEWLNRKEYNPFLWKAWMLMGRSQFHKGAFDEAASTFAYMSRLYATQPAIYGKARAWLAKCYIEQEWLYDAEDVITKMSRDSIDWRARKEWDYTFADFYIHTKRYEEAIPYLRKVIKHEMRKKQRAREWYLMGQLQTALDNKEMAYKAYKKVIAQNPPYELEFNARIAMTEVMAGGRSKQMISRLKRMALSDKNKDYLDQVYYAMGNIYMLQKDTVKAIAAYEKGNEKATRSGIEKGVLLLRLGDIYWTMEKFSDARRCYGEAIGLLDKDRDDYQQLSYRSKVLDELVPFTEAIHLQDSLQELAKMDEKDRNAAIDRVIEALIKKEKEEKRKQQEAEAEETLQKNGAVGNRTQQTKPLQPTNDLQNGLWYFYNQMAVNQGKQAFQKLWGKRENVDDWQRVNKTVVASEAGADELADLTDEQRDSIMQAEAVADSLEQVTDSAQNDPHKREYYLAQIPFTEEQVEASNLVIMDGLYNSGVIFKDKLDHLALSEKQFLRLTEQYPSYQQMDNAYYHMFLLYSRKGMHGKAGDYLDSLKNSYPESQWTQILSDPYFEDNARYGEHLEDSLYAATYDAFKGNRFAEAKANAEISKTRFPLGANRDKFIFISGLSMLNDGDSKGCLENMNEVVKNYPKSDVSPMAGMIINGVKEGRPLHGGKFDMDDVWSRRSVVLNDSDSIAARVFKAERDVDFCFIIAYEPDSVDENKLLFEMARYNFTNFLARNFDMEVADVAGLTRMNISGFRSYDEALQYARLLFNYEPVYSLLPKARTIIISKENLELLGTQYSYQDYDEFYEEHFIPLKIKTVQLLTEPSIVVYETEPEPEKKEEGDDEEGDDLFNGGVIDDNTLMELDILPEKTADEPNVIESVEPEKPVDEPKTIEPVKPNTIEPEKPVEEPNVIEPVEPEKPIEEPNVIEPAEPVEPEKPVEEEPAVTVTEEETPTDDDAFIIDDDNTTPTDDDAFIIDDDNTTTDDEDAFVIEEDEETDNSEDAPILLPDNNTPDDSNTDDDEYLDLDGF